MQVKDVKPTKSADELIQDNVRLAYKIAWGYNGCGIAIDDLIGLTQLGLVKAAKAYDESRGVRFTTYAGVVMRNEILQELRRTKKERGACSLDMIIEKDGDITLKDVIPVSESGFDIVELSDFHETMLCNLPERQRQAVELVVCLDMRQADAGRVLGLSQSVISRYVKCGLKNLRKQYWR